jgi:hypothetical protein
MRKLLFDVLEYYKREIKSTIHNLLYLFLFIYLLILFLLYSPDTPVSCANKTDIHVITDRPVIGADIVTYVHLHRY